MNKATMIFLSLLISTVIICSIIFCMCNLENVEHTGTITMKWDRPKLLTTHYYFEIDNETKISVYSYDYHKYDIGDIYTWWE